jgi:hypothetical protein
VQYKQQANPSLSIHNYSPLVISGNDTPPKLLSQGKLAFAKRNMFCKFGGTSKNILKNKASKLIQAKIYPFMSSLAQSSS